MATDPPVGSPAALLDHLSAEIRRGSGAPVSSFHARFGSGAVSIRCHGFRTRDILTRALLPALPGADETFTIDVIDGAACRVARPRLTWVQSDFGPKRMVPGWSGGDRSTYLLRGEGGVAVADWPGRRAIVWLPSEESLPWYECAAPFRWLFDGLAERSGLSTAHCAGIGFAGRGLLLAGPGGAGKSTLALAAIGAGFEYLGDDYCLIANHAPQAYALYSSGKWKKDARVTPEWLTEVQPHALDAAEQKNVIFLAEARPEYLAHRLNVQAIVVPGACALKAGLHAIAPAHALRALAASSLVQSEASGATLAKALAQMVRAVPAYRLESTTDLNRSLALLRSLLEKGGADD